MSTVMAVWPNNTTSVVVMENGWKPIDLFYELDHIGDPLAAKIWVLKRRRGLAVHATTDWVKKRCTSIANMDVSGEPDAANAVGCLDKKSTGVRVSLAGDSGAIKRFRWPAGIVRQFLFASWRDAVGQAPLREAVLHAECGKLLKDIPPPPPPMHKAKEVNQMEPFSGVYVAWNDDGTAHYVGESINVPSRVQASRPEIADRLVGVVQCDKNERLRLEALFIGLLNPAGNSQSVERAAIRDSARSTRSKP